MDENFEKPAVVLLPEKGKKYRCSFDDFVGICIGNYVRRDGEYGLVLQQEGTRVVHVYRLRWLTEV